jgi:hypothetical protein
LNEMKRSQGPIILFCRPHGGWKVKAICKVLLRPGGAEFWAEVCYPKGGPRYLRPRDPAKAIPEDGPELQRAVLEALDELLTRSWQ